MHKSVNHCFQWKQSDSLRWNFYWLYNQFNKENNLILHFCVKITIDDKFSMNINGP